MYVAHLFMAQQKPIEANDVSWVVQSLLGSLLMNGQVCSNDIPIAITATGYTATVLIPEKESLEAKHNNGYVRSALQRLTEVGLKEPECTLAEDLEGSQACDCGQPETFILYTRYLSVEPPLRCGNCFRPVPLYRLPKTDGDEYYDIVCWQSDYLACDTLQMGCRTMERAATRQISRWDSSLSRRGIAICEHIRELTQIPTYYYLYRYGARSRKQELERRCPSCDGEWLLPTAYNIFDFKCDTCRLLSNIAWNV
jgi:predicted  nucleic acid-binding Zn ribbon protein